MLDIGLQEILIIGVIALVVVGPKDLPKMLRTIGQWTGKARAYARDFQRSIEGYVEDTELSSIQKELAEATKELSSARREFDTEGQKINEDIAAVDKDLKEDVNRTGGVKAGEGPGNGAGMAAAAPVRNAEPDTPQPETQPEVKQAAADDKTDGGPPPASSGT